VHGMQPEEHAHRRGAPESQPHRLRGDHRRPPRRRGYHPYRAHSGRDPHNPAPDAEELDAGILKAAYAEAGSPLRALATLDPPVPVLHLYAQPDDPGYLAAQQSFAGAHPWFRVEKLQARSHFPMFEVPEAVAAAMEELVA